MYIFGLFMQFLMTNRVNPPACLPVFSLSLSPLSLTRDHIYLLLTAKNVAKKAKKVDLRITLSQRNNQNSMLKVTLFYICNRSAFVTLS